LLLELKRSFAKTTCAVFFCEVKRILT